MCLIIVVSGERLGRSVEKGKAWWYRHFPRIAAWRFGPATPPPQYDEGTALIGAAAGSNLMMHPSSGGIHKEMTYQVEIDSSQKEVGQRPSGAK